MPNKQNLPKPRYLNRDVGISKTVKVATGKKFYTPIVVGKKLRLSWTTKTRALAYGQMVLNRYTRKLAIQKLKEQN